MHGSLGIGEIERAYREFLALAAADENVVGVVLFGSRGAQAFVTERSDYDAFVVLRRSDETWQYVHGSAVEIVVLTLEAFQTYALPGFADAWNRPAFLLARVEIDKVNGEIERLVEQKRRLTPDEASFLAGNSLDGYINSLYRSLRNLEAGRELEGRLDAAESIPPLLTTSFALDGRVRPFNKWLQHALEQEPLTFDGLPTRVEAILRDANPDVQRALFRDVERHARAKGHGDVVDGWQPNIAWLRGEISE